MVYAQSNFRHIKMLDLHLVEGFVGLVTYLVIYIIILSILRLQDEKLKRSNKIKKMSQDLSFKLIGWTYFKSMRHWSISHKLWPSM